MKQDNSITYQSYLNDRVHKYDINNDNATFFLHYLTIKRSVMSEREGEL